MRGRLKPTSMTAASSKPSGRSCTSRRFNAGKFRIDDSSVIVPLSESTARALRLQLDVVEEAERLVKHHAGMSGQPERLHALAGARMSRDDYRFVVAFGEPVEYRRTALPDSGGEVDVLLTVRS